MIYANPPAYSDFDYAYVLRGAGAAPPDVLPERLEAFLPAEAVTTASSWVLLLSRLFAAIKETRPDPARNEVVLARYSCNEFSKAVLLAELTPRYVDLEADLTHDPARVEAAISSKTLAVLGVNNCGVASDNAALRALCDRRGVPYVEDATYTYLGTAADGRRFGTFGTFAILNFSEGKIIPCGGGGLVLNDPARRPVFERVCADLKQHGPRPARSELQRLLLYKLGGSPLGFSLHYLLKHALRFDLKRYFSMEPTRTGEASFDLKRAGEHAIVLEPGRRESLLGEPLRPLNVPKQLCGVDVVSHIDDVKSRRRRNAERWRDALADLPFVRFFDLPQDGVVVKLPFLLLEKPLDGDLPGRLERFGVMKQYPREYPMNGSPDFPNANLFYERLYTFPVHRFVDASVVERVRRTLIG